ncbi:hypothetical protein [Thioalkalivibrio sp. ALE16]|uniref:hypothetical protein n=1 Tax=Thioalkalivibrio sp. ALE16 TaxID=1158172 RepID=UPI00036929C5|nr:hypothetical protein [Thioalkalivibrio sp. ALE16]
MHCIGKRDDEVYVGNTDVRNREPGVPGHLSRLKTARIGEQALDIDGNPLPQDQWRPLFIGRSEAGVYDRIKMRQLHEIRMGLGGDHV